jgi:glycosyltransferase involved in cell wall biosynthesis
LFACEEEKALANTAFLGNEYRAYVTNYGIEDIVGNAGEQKDAFFADFPRLRDRKYVLFLGRLHPKKGLDLLIKAFVQLAPAYPDVDLAVVGPDEEGLMRKLKIIASRGGYEHRIHWIGMLSGDRKWGAFRSAAYFALPSHQENFGISVIESMALSVPVLITSKVNIWREVATAGGGIAVLDTVDAVRKGLRSMLDLPSDERLAMARRARSVFLSQFDLSKNAGALLKLIESLNGRNVCRPGSEEPKSDD